MSTAAEVVRRTPRIGAGSAAITLVAVGAIAALSIVPSAGSLSAQTTLLNLLIYAGLAQAWNLVGGYAGQLSLGHSVFVGAGGYTTAMLLIDTGTPAAVAVVLAGAVGAGLAVATSVALLRLRGAYFAIGSLAVALALQAWMVNWQYTGASKGLNIPLRDLPSTETIYFVALGFVVATCAIAWWFERSAFGLRVMAVRDNEDGARALGVNGTMVKATVLVMSGALTAMLGAVVAFNQIALVPDNFFGIDWVINMVIMTIIGGMGTVLGPLIGAGVVYYGIEKQLESHPAIASTLTGALVIVVIAVAPGGIWGGLRQLAALSLGIARGRRRPERVHS